MISIVVPAYNEQERIIHTLDNIKNVLADLSIEEYEIFVVDDGSVDNTARVCEEYIAANSKVKLLLQPQNQGMGAAILTGLKAANYPKCMFIPGDNDMSLVTMRQLLALREVADLVMAVPINLEGRSTFRNVLSFLYRIMFMVGFGVRINYINAAGIYPTEKLRELDLCGRRFSLIAEANLKLLRMGITFAEVPAYVKDPPRTWRTVSLRNLFEVSKNYLRLMRVMHRQKKFKDFSCSRRIYIDFSSPFRKGNTPIVLTEEQVFGKR